MMNFTSLSFVLFLWTSPLWSTEPGCMPMRSLSSDPVGYSKPIRQKRISSPARSNSNTISKSSLAESFPPPPLPPALPEHPPRPTKSLVPIVVPEEELPQRGSSPGVVRQHTSRIAAVSYPRSKEVSMVAVPPPRRRSLTRLPQKENPPAPLLPIALGNISFTALQLMKILEKGGAFQVVPDKGIRSIIAIQPPIKDIGKRAIWVKEEGEENDYWLDGRNSLLHELQQHERIKRLTQISWHPEHKDVREARVYINQMPTRWHICLLSTESQYRRWSRMTELKRWATEYIEKKPYPVFFPHPTKIQYMILAKGPFDFGSEWQFFKIWNDQTSTESPDPIKLAQQLQKRLVFMKEEPHHPLPGLLGCLDDPPRRWNAYFIGMKAKDWESEKEFCATYEPWRDLSYFRQRKYRKWITAAAAPASQSE